MSWRGGAGLSSGQAPAQWWAGLDHAAHRAGLHLWTSDPHSALQFDTKEAAERAARRYFEGDIWEATEHEFVSAPAQGKVRGPLVERLRNLPGETLVKLSHPSGELIDRPVLCDVSELRDSLVSSAQGATFGDGMMQAADIADRTNQGDHKAIAEVIRHVAASHRNSGGKDERYEEVPDA